MPPGRRGHLHQARHRPQPLAWVKAGREAAPTAAVIDTQSANLHQPTHHHTGHRRDDAQHAVALRDELIDVHLDARADLLDNPFHTGQRFGERLDNYLLSPGFDLVTVRIGEELVGYAFGGTLPANTLWWQGAEVTDPDVIHETGQRTFAFREILVRRAHQRRGYAHRLHDELLGARSEERATLLVRDDNPARNLYLRWGWHLVGHLQPFPDSPRFEAMVIPLPLA